MPRYSTLKFNNKPNYYDGHYFASQLERSLYQQLKIREKAGEVSNVRCQQPVYLTAAAIKYVADFIVYDHKLKADVIWEAKGKETERWKIIKELYPYYGTMRLYIFGRIKHHEEIIPLTILGHNQTLSVGASATSAL